MTRKKEIENLLSALDGNRRLIVQALNPTAIVKAGQRPPSPNELMALLLMGLNAALAALSVLLEEQARWVVEEGAPKDER